MAVCLLACFLSSRSQREEGRGNLEPGDRGAKEIFFLQMRRGGRKEQVAKIVRFLCDDILVVLKGQ